MQTLPPLRRRNTPEAGAFNNGEPVIGYQRHRDLARGNNDNLCSRISKQFSSWGFSAPRITGLFGIATFGIGCLVLNSISTGSSAIGSNAEHEPFKRQLSGEAAATKPVEWLAEDKKDHCEYMKVMIMYAGAHNTNEAFAGCEPKVNVRDGSPDWWTDAINMRRGKNIDQFPSVSGNLAAGNGQETDKNVEKMERTKVKRGEIDKYFEERGYKGCETAAVQDVKTHDNSWISAVWERDQGNTEGDKAFFLTAWVQDATAGWGWRFIGLYRKQDADGESQCKNDV